MMRLFLLTCLLLGFFSAYGQKENLLKNPSLEGIPGPSTPPADWLDCGFSGETPVDLQPESTFNVTKDPRDGYSYLGMVARDNGTWEGISQHLKQPLEADKTYVLRLYLAQSERYESPSRKSRTDKIVNYITPLRCLIWGSSTPCGQDELLAATGLIDHPHWQEYLLELRPTVNHPYLKIEVVLDPAKASFANGNMLVDHLALHEVASNDNLQFDTNFREFALSQQDDYEHLRRTGGEQAFDHNPAKRRYAGQGNVGNRSSAPPLAARQKEKKETTDLAAASIKDPTAAKRYSILQDIHKRGTSTGLYNLALTLDDPFPYIEALEAIGATKTQEELARAIELRDRIRAKGQQEGDKQRIRYFFRQQPWARELNRKLQAFIEQHQ